MKGKLILLGAPSGGGKSTIARFIAASDKRFKLVQVYTNRGHESNLNITKPRQEEEDNKSRIIVSTEEIKTMEHIFKRDYSVYVNVNEKDGTYYAIRRDAIEPFLSQGYYMLLEWNTKKMNHFDGIFPNVKILILPESEEHILRTLEAGRDPTGERRYGIKDEMNKIRNGIIPRDLLITNNLGSFIDTVEKIRNFVLGLE